MGKNIEKIAFFFVLMLFSVDRAISGFHFYGKVSRKTQRFPD